MKTLPHRKSAFTPEISLHVDR